jgi:hypothetical protein
VRWPCALQWHFCWQLPAFPNLDTYKRHTVVRTPSDDDSAHPPLPCTLALATDQTLAQSALFSPSCGPRTGRAASARTFAGRRALARGASTRTRWRAALTTVREPSRRDIASSRYQTMAPTVSTAMTTRPPSAAATIMLGTSAAAARPLYRNSFGVKRMPPPAAPAEAIAAARHLLPLGRWVWSGTLLL